MLCLMGNTYTYRRQVAQNVAWKFLCVSRGAGVSTTRRCPRRPAGDASTSRLTVSGNAFKSFKSFAATNETVCAKPCTPLSVRPAHQRGLVFVVSFANRGASAFCVAAEALNAPTDQGASDASVRRKGLSSSSFLFEGAKYFSSSALHAQPLNPGP